MLIEKDSKVILQDRAMRNLICMFLFAVFLSSCGGDSGGAVIVSNTPQTIRTIFTSTKNDSKNGFYINDVGGKVLLPSIEKTQIYLENTPWTGPYTKIEDITFSCDSSDSVSSAIKYESEGSVALLNFADAFDIGGYPNSSNAQEESLMRSSNLFIELSTNSALTDNGVQYKPDISESLDKQAGNLVTKNVSFFKDSKGKYFDSPKTFAVVSAVGLNMTKVYGDRKPYGTPENQQKLRKEKWENILKSMARNDAEVLILGALGAGVFTVNDAQKQAVADAFYEVISSLKSSGIYGKSIKRIHFPIFVRKDTDTESPNEQKTYEIFKSMINKVIKDFNGKFESSFMLSRISSHFSLPEATSNTFGKPFFHFHTTKSPSFFDMKSFDTALTGMLYNIFTHINLSHEKEYIKGYGALLFKGTLGFSKSLDHRAKLLMGALFDHRSTSFYNTSLSRYGFTSGLYHNLNTFTKVKLGIDILESVPAFEIPSSVGAWVHIESELKKNVTLKTQVGVNSLEGVRAQIFLSMSF